MLNRAQSGVVGSRTNDILPSTGEDRVMTFIHVQDRLRVTDCGPRKVGDDDKSSVDQQREAHPS